MVGVQVDRMKSTEAKRSPSAPYMTSTMLTDAANHLGSSVAGTMATAQALFEGGDAGEACRVYVVMTPLSINNSEY